MAEASQGARQPSALPDVGQASQVMDDLMREFEERLQYSDSSDDEEFHDACALLEQGGLESEGDGSGGQNERTQLDSAENVIRTGEIVRQTESIGNVEDNSNGLIEINETGVPDRQTDGHFDRLPEFCDIESSQMDSVPLAGEACGAGFDEEGSVELDTDKLVQEAVEEGATMEEVPEENVVIDEEQILKDLEKDWSEEEKEDKKAEAQELKNSGNALFKQGTYEEAKDQYSQALGLCPTCFPKERSIMYSNRAACKMRLEEYEDAVKDSTKALELNPGYLKCLLRRAELHEKTEKLEEAFADYQKVLEIDPSIHSAREACMRLPDQIKERNEKLKEEMMGKLKDLGNMILKPFGLSTENFQLNQDPNSGGYSVNFKR